MEWQFDIFNRIMEVGPFFGVVCTLTYTSPDYPHLIDHLYPPRRQERGSLMDI